MEPATPAEVQAALTASAGLGLFFGWRSPSAEEQAWHPVSLLYQLTPGPLDDLIEQTATALGGCEPRVTASLFFQGYAARLLSPQLGCLATSGCVPAVPPADLRWRHQGALELGLTPDQGWRGPAPELASVVLTQTFATHLRPLITATRARVRLPATVLTDNAVSAFVQALSLLDRLLRPGWAALAPGALAEAGLARTGTFRPGSGFVRRSCCLYYRVAGGGYCGDCPIRPSLPVDGFERPPGGRRDRSGAEQPG
jgi:ferric iron reductase protein FhuF